ncbi:MAG: hypothetical protein M0P61_00045 [Ignavibacteriaceae bacterium]|jgi:hypothetical protein|nr:hypothetical protein [Ignavibacteriaceae bacterium]
MSINTTILTSDGESTIILNDGGLSTIIVKKKIKNTGFPFIALAFAAIQFITKKIIGKFYEQTRF